MGRAPCCDKATVKRGPWSPEEDAALKSYIEQHGGPGGNWIALPAKIGLKRCGKSCRLRWLNYLRPNIRHGGFSEEEDRIIISLYISIGSRWSVIAGQMPGRTDNDIKNYWNTRLKKKLFGTPATSSSSSRRRGNDAAAARATAALYAHAWPELAMAAASLPALQTTDGAVDDQATMAKLSRSHLAPPATAVSGGNFADNQQYGAAPYQIFGEALQASSATTAFSAPELDMCFRFDEVELDGLDSFFSGINTASSAIYNASGGSGGDGVFQDHLPLNFAML